MSLDTDIAILGQARPLSLLERDALRLLAFSGDRRRLRPGDVLFRKGETSFGGAVVMSGEIGLDEDQQGEPRQIARAGALIGEVALLVATQHPAQAVARADSEAIVISRHLFKRVLEEFPQNASAIHQAYAADLRRLSGQTALIRQKIDQIG
jgi:CRP-like cAMP-binding protein